MFKIKVLAICFIATSLSAEQIAIVEGKKVFSNSKKGRELEIKLNKQRNSLEIDIKKIEEQIDSEVSNLNKKARTESSENIEKMEFNIITLKQERDRKSKSIQTDFDKKVEEEMAKYNSYIKEQISKFAQIAKLDIVFLKENGEIIYNSAGLDKTDDIIKFVNTGTKPEPAIKNSAPKKCDINHPVVF